MKSSLILFTVVLLGVLTASCLNPNLINQTAGGIYPTAPGDEPFLLVRIVNDTTATLDVPIVYDDGTGAKTFLFNNITPAAREAGILLDWPVTRVNVGNLENPFVPTIGTSLADGANVLIAPNIFPAQAGTDFNRGDTLVYRFVGIGTNASAIGVTLGRIDGATQTGPFTRGDTFFTVEQIIELNSAAGTGS